LGIAKPELLPVRLPGTATPLGGLPPGLEEVLLCDLPPGLEEVLLCDLPPGVEEMVLGGRPPGLEETPLRVVSNLAEPSELPRTAVASSNFATCIVASRMALPSSVRIAENSLTAAGVPIANIWCNCVVWKRKAAVFSTAKQARWYGCWVSTASRPASRPAGMPRT
jgi:hypothetical protein